MSKIKVTGNEEYKLFYQKRVDLPQTNTEMIIGPFYTYRRMHFTSENP